MIALTVQRQSGGPIMSRRIPSFHRRHFLRGATALGATLVLPRLGTAQSAGQPFRMAALIPLTGSIGFLGPAMQRTIRYAVDEVNAAGGAGGRMIELYTEDEQSQPEAAVLAAKKLIEVNKVQAIVGTAVSGATLAVMPLVQDAGIIQMCVSGAPQISTEDKKDLVWRFQATNDRYGKAFAGYAAKRGFKRPATMSLNNPAGLSITDGFTETWRKLGNDIVESVIYEPQRATYRSELQRVLAANPDVIVMGSYLPDATIVLREWYQSGKPMQWIIPTFTANDKLIKALGPEVVEGIISIDSASYEAGDTYRRLSSRYQQEFGEPISIFAAMSYDMVISLALAMEAAGPGASVLAVNGKLRDIANQPGRKVFDFAAGKAALREGPIDYDGASSRLEFDQYGDASPDFAVQLIKNGALVRDSIVSI